MTLLLFYTLCLVVAVFLGAKLDSFVRLTHTRTQLLMSLISGLLLGVAVFHLLPHAVYVSDVSIDRLAQFLMLGLLAMFFLQRLFHFHQHEYDAHSHAAHCEHASDMQANDFSKAGFGVFIGLSLHSIMDGIALAFSMNADWLSHPKTDHISLAAVGVFCAILLHKPLDALTLSHFFRAKGKSERFKNVVLLAYALICPLVVAVVFMLGDVYPIPHQVVACVLAFSMGIFLCVALSDLLPEIHFHNHDRGKMALMLLLGVGLSLVISFVESDQRHHHQQTDVLDKEILGTANTPSHSSDNIQHYDDHQH